jgi:hypothetical protein
MPSGILQDIYYAKANAIAKALSENQKSLPAVCRSIGQKRLGGTAELTQETPEDLIKDAQGRH